MRQFNYYGRTRLESLDENDIDGLKREIDFIVRNQLLGFSPAPKFTDDARKQGIDDLGSQSLPKKRTKTAGGPGQNARSRKKNSLLGKKNLMSGQADIMHTADQINYSKSQPNMQNEFTGAKPQGMGQFGLSKDGQSSGFRKNVLGANPD